MLHVYRLVLYGLAEQKIKGDGNCQVLILYSLRAYASTELANSIDSFLKGDVVTFEVGVDAFCEGLCLA